MLDITVELQVGLSIVDPDKTVNPTDGEEIGIDVTLNASVPASIQIRNSAGITILIIPVTTPTSSPDRYNWDGKDDSGFIVNDGVYYAILRYQYGGGWKNYDLTNTTGGQRYSFPFGSGCDTRDNIRSTFDPFEDDLLPMGFRLCSAQKVTGFIGPLWGGGAETRIRTLLNQEAFSAGEHTIYWDGLDDDGNVAEPPPGDSLITGFWRYSLSDNAIYVTGGRPVVTNVSADPNYFSPFSEKCDQYGNGEGINLTYTVSENVSSVKLRVYSPETGRIEREIINNTVTAGEHTIYWDGKNGSGEYVDISDYQIGVFAKDTEGNTSMWRYTLVRIDY
ncbi:MAG: FlgD immunoglobulin-like domain containing protein [Thermodesulfobacteriota bacterium]|nr:FlgD immunoglobulin-like domain containing protein [Thermodesulfobacteriota bacterium]